jgi:hypothetical protein
MAAMFIGWELFRPDQKWGFWGFGQKIAYAQ